MTDAPKLSPQQEMEMAERAAAIVNDQAFRRAVNLVNRMYYDAWCATAPDDVAQRELLFAKAHVLDDVVTQLAAVIGTGKITAAQLAAAGSHPVR